jgi:TolA-binding protein
METLDDLLIKRRRGALTAAEARRLDNALRASREYELALLAQDAFERDGEPGAGDAERLRELVDAIERRLPPARRVARGWRAPLRVAVPVLIAGAAAAAVGMYRVGPIERAAPPRSAAALPPRSAIALPPREPSVVRPSFAPPVQEIRESGEAPAQPAPEARPMRREALPSRRAAMRVKTLPAEATHAVSPSPAMPRDASAVDAPRVDAPRVDAPPGALSAEDSAQSLFRRANRLRQSDWPAAARLYAELIHRHPTSNEAGVAQVALGKWSLAQGRSGDALEWFRAYQRRAPGALTAEALFGEARALESIGSVSAAREPWRRLLDTYPDSPYASVARQRLGLP